MTKTPFLNAGSTLRCQHGGILIAAGNVALTTDGLAVLTEADLRDGRIVGCTQYGHGRTPCTRIVSIDNAKSVLIDGQRVLLETTRATTDGVPGNRLQIQPNQTCFVCGGGAIEELQVPLSGDNILRSDNLDATPSYRNASPGQSGQQEFAEETDETEGDEVSAEAAGLQEILDKENSEFSDPVGKGRMRAVAEYVRKQYESYPPKIKAFKQQTDLAAEQKVATMGKLTVEVAKMQYYIGAVFYEGGKWERRVNKDGSFTNTNNRGELIDEYTRQSSKHGTPTGGFWCTKFATYCYSMVLGTRAQHRDDPQSRRGAFGGSQISNGYEDFWDYDENQGGRFVGQRKRGDDNVWADLRTEVAGLSTKVEKIQAIRSFFDENFCPQTGDIMITGDRKNSFKYHIGKLMDSSHTTMIESVVISDEDAFIYTIEGNSGDMVTGRRYDLTATTGKWGLHKIVNISRMSLENHGRSTTLGDQTDIRDLEGAPTFNEDQLLTPLKEANALLKDYAAEQGVINGAGTCSATSILPR